MDGAESFTLGKQKPLTVKYLVIFNESVRVLWTDLAQS